MHKQNIQAKNTSDIVQTMLCVETDYDLSFKDCGRHQVAT